MPFLIFALVAGWGAASWLAYELIATRGRLLVHADRVAVTPSKDSLRAGSADDNRGYEYRVTEFGLRLGSEHAFFLKAQTEVRALTQMGARFSRHDDGRLLCHVGGITTCVRTIEEMWILHEIFVEGVYNVLFAGPAGLLGRRHERGHREPVFRRAWQHEGCWL